LAEAYLTNGLKSKAIELLADLVQRYPSSSHAAEARQKLDAIEKGK
jgi:outer membrane protein assembly factor BamD (BamD/ComL family)